MVLCVAPSDVNWDFSLHCYLLPYYGQASHGSLAHFTSTAAQIVMDLRRMVGLPQGFRLRGFRARKPLGR